jgi:hypothetical protein
VQYPPKVKSCEIRPIGGASYCGTIGYVSFGVSFLAEYAADYWQQDFAGQGP